MELELSNLPKTWLIDIDGTIVKHNGYKNGKDILLEGVKDFFDQLDKRDSVILLTARSEEFREITEEFLQVNHIRYDKIIFGLPTGERILINDNKPSGLVMGHVFNKERDKTPSLSVRINENL
jgi:uncharacterized HAD superfamily protein